MNFTPSPARKNIPYFFLVEKFCFLSLSLYPLSEDRAGLAYDRGKLVNVFGLHYL